MLVCHNFLTEDGTPTPNRSGCVHVLRAASLATAHGLRASLGTTGFETTPLRELKHAETPVVGVVGPTGRAF